MSYHFKCLPDTEFNSTVISCSFPYMGYLIWKITPDLFVCFNLNASFLGKIYVSTCIRTHKHTPIYLSWHKYKFAYRKSVKEVYVIMWVHTCKLKLLFLGDIMNLRVLYLYRQKVGEFCSFRKYRLTSMYPRSSLCLGGYKHLHVDFYCWYCLVYYILPNARWFVCRIRNLY